MKLYIVIGFFLSLLATEIFSQELDLKENKEFKGLGAYVSQAGFSPFGNYFAYTLGTNVIRVFDKNWEKIYEHQGDPESKGGSFAFSPDGEYLAYARYKGKTDIAILRLSDQKVVQVLDRHSDYIYDLEFSHDGNFLSSCGTDNTMVLWHREGESYSFAQQYDGFENYLYESSFSFDDRFLASGDRYGNIKIYEKSSIGYKLYQEFKFRKHAINSIAFNPRKYEFVTGSSYGIRRYTFKNSKFVLSDTVSDKAYIEYPMSYSPQGDFLAVTYYQEIKIYKVLPDSLQLVDVNHRHSQRTSGATFSENGKFLTSYASDEKIIIWEIQNVAPSQKALVSSWLLGDLSLAQRRSLSPVVTDKIINEISHKLSAPRDEFEKTVDYNKRMELLSDHALSILQQEMEKLYGVKVAGNIASIPLTTLLGYNADLEIYKIRMMDTEAGVRIPVEAAKKLKKNWQGAMIKVKKKILDDKKSAEYKDFVLTLPGASTEYEVIPVANPFQQGSASNAIRGTNVQTVSSEIKSDTANGTTYALLFATNVYDFYEALINPVLDARTIATELQENYGVKVELVTNPTLAETASKLHEFASAKYAKKDNLMVFFAGHGIYDEVFREGYVISRDSKSDDLGKTSYLSHSNLRTMINNINCPHIFLVMDVCFGGTFDPHLSSGHRGAAMYADISAEEFVERKLKYTTRLYLTSGGKEYVPDGRPGFHSPFARRFIESLRYYGGEDGVLTTSEILQFVEKVNPQPRFGEFGDNEPGSDFILVIKKEG